MTVNSTLDIVLRNDTGAAQLYAYITGTDDKGLVLIGNDGSAEYRPVSPKGPMEPVPAEWSIHVGGPGSTRTLRVPRMAGGRIWFCKDRPLALFVNPGPSLVEPSATNSSDPNYNLDWAFCEFTWNQQQLYANISFVDFVGLPVSLQLKTVDGSTKRVPGMPADGLTKVCNKLEEQARRDGRPWDKLVIRDKDDKILRALSPVAGEMLHAGLFDRYYQPYVDAVWAKYAKDELTVDTQSIWGQVKGRVEAGEKLTFGAISFGKPSSGDIFSCSTGPFAGGQGVTGEQLNIGARLAAAFNRSTLLDNANQPEGEKVGLYYHHPVTNHYARACHETSVGGPWLRVSLRRRRFFPRPAGPIGVCQRSRPKGADDWRWKAPGRLTDFVGTGSV